MFSTRLLFSVYARFFLWYLFRHPFVFSAMIFMKYLMLIFFESRLGIILFSPPSAVLEDTRQVWPEYPEESLVFLKIVIRKLLYSPSNPKSHSKSRIFFMANATLYKVCGNQLLSLIKFPIESDKTSSTSSPQCRGLK